MTTLYSLNQIEFSQIPEIINFFNKLYDIPPDEFKKKKKRGYSVEPEEFAICVNY